MLTKEERMIVLARKIECVRIGKIIVLLDAIPMSLRYHENWQKVRDALIQAKQESEFLMQTAEAMKSDK